MRPKFLGASTGRAGSLFISQVLDRAGIPTLHEFHYNAKRLPWGPWDRPELGEWSAQAVPKIAEIKPQEVWHQVRHPLKVVGSYLGFGLFHNPVVFGEEGAWMAQHAGITGRAPLDEAVRYYIGWNERCEQYADVRWRVEDVTADTIVSLGGRVGVEVTYGAARKALLETSTDTNTRRNARTLTWDDIPTEHVDRLRSMADRYGYEERHG